MRLLGISSNYRALTSQVTSVFFFCSSVRPLHSIFMCECNHYATARSLLHSVSYACLHLYAFMLRPCEQRITYLETLSALTIFVNLPLLLLYKFTCVCWGFHPAFVHPLAKSRPCFFSVCPFVHNIAIVDVEM